MSDKQASKNSNDPSIGRNAGGIFMAVGTIGGAIVGGLLGQPSLGLLGGLILGGLIALLIWLRER